MNSLRFILCTAGFLLLSGCGGPPPHSASVNFVEGMITLNGQPLPDAFIQFIPKTPDTCQVAGGYSDKSGNYKLTSQNGDDGKGAEAGDYVVVVSKIDRTETWPPGADTNAVSPTVTEKETVPVVYTDRTKSTVFKTVNKGKNKIDIELVSTH